MKTIRTSKVIHDRLLDDKTAELKSIDAVIENLYEENRIMRNSLEDHMVTQNILLSHEEHDVVYKGTDTEYVEHWGNDE